MRQLIFLLFLFPAIVLGQAKEKEVNERVNYFKSQPIFVLQFELDEKVLAKLSNSEINEAKSELERTNKNIRIAFNTFWDINDTIMFVPADEWTAKKREFKGAIFFEPKKFTEYTNDRGHVVAVIAFQLSRPNKPDYFKNVVPRFGIDSSLVNIVTELRQLKLHVTTGDVVNKKDLGTKLILINKDDQKSQLGINYVDDIRSKFSDSILEVDDSFIMEALMRRDPRFIYIKNGSTFNVEDGTLIPLY